MPELAKLSSGSGGSGVLVGVAVAAGGVVGAEVAVGCGGFVAVGMLVVAARDLASDLGGEIGDVERLDPARAALAVKEALPRGIDAACQRRHHPEPCDDYPPHQRFLDQLSTRLARF